MNEFLESADGWVPLIMFILSGVVLLIAIVLMRQPLNKMFSDLSERIGRGASVKAGPLEIGQEVGQLVTSTASLISENPEVETWGQPDQMQLLFKAQGRGWKKSTKAMEVPGGCLVQVTTERESADGDWSSAEALQFVPGVVVVDCDGALGRTLAAADR